MKSRHPSFVIRSIRASRSGIDLTAAQAARMAAQLAKQGWTVYVNVPHRRGSTIQEREAVVCFPTRSKTGKPQALCKVKPHFKKKIKGKVKR